MQVQLPSSGEFPLLMLHVGSSVMLFDASHRICEIEAADRIDFQFCDGSGTPVTSREVLHDPVGDQSEVIDSSEATGDSDEPPADPDQEQTEEAPVEEAPVEEAPVEEAPVEEAPVEEAPAEEAPAEEAPAEEAPAEEAPGEEAAVEEAPEAPSTEA